jgi:hypothetical protein
MTAVAANILDAQGVYRTPHSARTSAVGVLPLVHFGALGATANQR